MPEITHQILEYMAAEYASAVECRTAIAQAIRRRVLEIAEEMGPSLREAAAAERDCHAALRDAVDGARHLFEKPKTRTNYGIQYGVRASRPSIEVPDEAKSIRLIREKIDPAQHPLLIQVRETVYKPAVLDLEAKYLRMIGIRQVQPDDAVVVKPVADSVDRLVSTLLAEVEDGADE